MPFSKAFPKSTDKSVYPRWEEVYLSKEEEQAVEEDARTENIELMKSCIKDATIIFQGQGLKPYQTDIINTAIALFEKRASHEVFWKEEKAKEKFDSKNDKSVR